MNSKNDLTEVINETIIYLNSQIISIELKMIFLNVSPLD